MSVGKYMYTRQILSRSVNVKFDSAFGLPMYGFLLLGASHALMGSPYGIAVFFFPRFPSSAAENGR